VGRTRRKAAYDDLIQGATGMPWLLKESGAEGPRYAPATIADRSVGLHVVNAVCAALYRREKTGRGQRIDVPMFESCYRPCSGSTWAAIRSSRRPATPAMRACSPRNAGHTRQKMGYVCVLVYNDKQWRAFFELIGQRGLLHDPRFATQEARSRDFEAAYRLVAAEMAKRTTSECIAMLERADIPVQRMNSLKDIVEDPHLAAIGYFKQVEHPTEGRIKSMAVPSEWSESKPEYRRHAPRLGEHTREVLREAGYDDNAIKRLIDSGAAGPLR
jgi:crotonobetainyl-CoA:carnitine CoA-transferase CaiB-like acyl-CoA transferase